jgi:hypothetical protein
MSLSELENLLIKIRDGDVSDDVCMRAEALLSRDERLPVELRTESLRDDPAATAVALLSVLGHDDGFGLNLAEALAFELNEDLGGMLSSGPISNAVNRGPETGPLEISVEMVAAVEADGLPIAPAVVAEAGHCDVAAAVMNTLDLVHSLPLAEAIAELAGPVDVVQDVMVDLGQETVPVAQAVLAEAGTVDVVEAVMREVRKGALVPGLPVADLEPANRSWMRWSAVALAAAALISIVSVPFLQGGDGQTVAEPGFQFASAAEIVVNDLSYDEGAFVQVIHDTDDNGEQALIIWIDDEAVL